MADFNMDINKNEAFDFAQPPAGAQMPDFSGMKLPPMEQFGDFPFFGSEDTPAVDATVKPDATSMDTPVEPKEKTEMPENTKTQAEPEAKETEAEAKEEAEAEVEEKTEKRKRRSRKKKEQQEEDQSTEPVQVNAVTMEIKSDLSVSEIINQLNLLPDGNFAKAKEDIANMMNAIQVEKDMDKATILVMNQRIDELDDLISSRYAAAKAAYNNFCNEKDGFLPMTIERNKRIANERGVKHYILAGINAAVEYPLPNGSKVNLFQAAWALRYEAQFFEDVARQLETKRRLVKSQSDALAAIA